MIVINSNKSNKRKNNCLTFSTIMRNIFQSFEIWNLNKFFLMRTRIVQNHVRKAIKEDSYYRIISTADYLYVCVGMCYSIQAFRINVFIGHDREKLEYFRKEPGFSGERDETNRAESRRNRSTRAKHRKQLSNPRNRMVCAIWFGPRGGERQIVLNVRIGKAGVGIFEELLVLLETICINLE